MRYKSFRIRNFKGIKDTKIDFTGIGGASVFAFVGLNESGKTTILEAIHSFSPDSGTSEIVGGDKDSGVPFSERVPRHLISTFTGYVSVEATLLASKQDKIDIADTLKTINDLIVDPDSIPDLITFERKQEFRDGDFVKSFFNSDVKILVRSTKQRKCRVPTPEESKAIRSAIYSQTPNIAYFPTFVFEFPQRIFLTNRGGVLDRFYRRVFQDILDFDGRGHTIKKDIIRRIRGEERLVPWIDFFSSWLQDDDRDKIQHVMDRASQAVTLLVFGRWNRIFGEDTRGKEVVISYEVVEGENIDKGSIQKTNEHDLYINFQIRDGTRRFNVNDRSLGFRWFFAFMLFTQFRVARSRSAPLLFLFDEPASNLHAAAQQKLIESFPAIAQGEHTLVYTTHSHYMIEPKWLEQTFIVTNRADAPTLSVVEAASLEDESLDIKARTYRSFVNEHPNQASYFQPILDRLQVAPSRLDLKRSSIVLEGKSDFYILRYAQRAAERPELPLIPGLGAGTFGALAALHVGWNLDFIFVLDGDAQGKLDKQKYAADFGIPMDRLLTLDQLVPGISVIEDILDGDAMEKLRSELQLQSMPSKSQMRRFFQERLASDRCERLSSGFMKKAESILTAMEERLSELRP